MPLEVVVATSVAAAAAAAALGLPVTTVRISWTPIAGTTTGMETDSRGLAGRRRLVVSNPDLPHCQDDVVTMVTVPMSAATAFWEPPAAHQAVLVVPIIEARLPGCYSRGGQACPRALCARWGP